MSQLSNAARVRMQILRLFFMLLLLGSAISSNAQTITPALPWQTSLSAALTEAKTSNRPVLAVFSGSDWCKPCIMLKEEVFDTPEFESYAKERFILARFDFPRNKKHKLSAEQTKINEEAAAQLNMEGSFPLVVLLSPDGKVLAKTGYLAGGPQKYDEHLSTLLTRTK